MTLPLPATPEVHNSEVSSTIASKGPNTPSPGKRSFSVCSIAWDIAAVFGALIISPLTGGNYEPLLAQYAPLIVIIAAFDISARVGAPNIAVASVSTLGAIAVAKSHEPFFGGLLLAIVCTLIVGVVFAWAVVVRRISSWVVSIALMSFVAAVSVTFLLPELRVAERLDISSSWIPILKAAGAASILIVMLGIAVRPVGFGRKLRKSTLGVVLVGSCVLAGVYGALFASVGGTLNVVPRNDTMLFAITASVVGGTSLTGRRAGSVGPWFAGLSILMLEQWVERRRPGFKASFYVQPALLVGALGIHALLDHRTDTSEATARLG